ncbi:MAG TPA: cytochrome d ubiquinol oxidase subunit II [Elusimicrobia bacterium]|nr:cytochrome d ubiquinol oxidase subunit II [Elusimicrobiota bacterium]
MSLDLNAVWFFLVALLLAGYALLDGFDLGVGALHLFAEKDEDRRVLLNAIGPVWDGNEVWLLTAGGAVFAAFPPVYATVFSGFYLALMLLLVALIARAVAIEFRSKQPMPLWRSFWDRAFAAGSILAAVLLGVAFGNLVRGVPVGADGEFAGAFFGLLHPYPLLMGFFALALFALHGALYLTLKTEGALLEKARGWARKAFDLFAAVFIAMMACTLFFIPRIGRALGEHPLLLLAPLAAILAVANLRRELCRGRDFQAFLSSCALILALAAFFAGGMFPALVYSLPEAQNSLSAYNASSSQKTLAIMLVIAGLGMPLVIAYKAFVYWVFRGKVTLGPASY